MKKLLFACSLALSAPAFADVDPEYFCHDLRGYEPAAFQDTYSRIATFWKNREGLYELRIAGHDLAPGLVVPGKAPNRYTRSIVVAFQENECLTDKNDVRTCKRVVDETYSPIWIWGDSVDPLAPSHPKSKEDPESIVQAKSITARLSPAGTKLQFRTVEGRKVGVNLRCDAPSWEWYPHVPLDELEAQAH